MYLILKRILDIILSCVGLIFVLIIFPFVALAIKLNSRGPVFFKAKRISQGRVVIIYKFRTMFQNAHQDKNNLKHLNERSDGPFFKIKNDPRITSVGKTLRKFWLDETPQFWNVLKGDISLVGPRPYEPDEINKYPKDYLFLRQEKSGITGLSQVKGSSNLTFNQVLFYDAYYIKNRSFWLDLKIIWKTILLLFNPSGV